MEKKKIIMSVMMFLVIVGFLFAYQGYSMHQDVLDQEIQFHDLQKQYFSKTKAVRDSAPANSETAKQLIEIVNYPSELMALKLLGLGRILQGIFVLLFAIVIALVMMPVRLGMIMKDNK